MNSTALAWGISLGVPLVLGIIAKLWPKEKAIALANKLGDTIGLAITTFGNSRVGKKVWNKVEEGPITTILAFGMALFVRIGSKVVADNYTNEDNKNAK